MDDSSLGGEVWGAGWKGALGVRAESVFGVLMPVVARGEESPLGGWRWWLKLSGKSMGPVERAEGFDRVGGLEFEDAGSTACPRRPAFINVLSEPQSLSLYRNDLSCTGFRDVYRSHQYLVWLLCLPSFQILCHWILWLFYIVGDTRDLGAVEYPRNTLYGEIDLKGLEMKEGSPP